MNALGQEQPRSAISSLVRTAFAASLAGLLCGLSSALFLWLLDLATEARVKHEWLVFGLPVAGFAMGWVYRNHGKTVARGTNLVLETVYQDGPQLPTRMAPMVLVATVLTHLFGGSAGREGTAVQMGASSADWLAHRLRLSRDERRQLLSAGIAGGFGAVFGTPLAGAIFGLEVLGRRRLELGAAAASVIAAFVGDLTTRGLGIEHTNYPRNIALPLSITLSGKWLIFAAGCAAASVLFTQLIAQLKKYAERYLPRLELRMLLGGAVLVGLWQLLGESRYLGLGVPVILESFQGTGQPAEIFLLKIVFTAITVAAGFQGGEVTPLFFVGASLGSLLADLLGIPVALGAGVGLAAVFAASAKSPLALSIMAAELFGASVLPHAAIVCTLATLLSGESRLYSSQRPPLTGRPTA